jgi:hypothetical protein
VSQLLEIMQRTLMGLQGQELFVAEPDAEVDSTHLISQRLHNFLSDICWRRRRSTGEQHRKAIGLLLSLLYRRGELSDYLSFLESANVAHSEQTEPTIPAQLANDTLQKLCNQLHPDAAQDTLQRVQFAPSADVGLCQVAWAIVKVVHALGASSALGDSSERSKRSVAWSWSTADCTTVHRGEPCNASLGLVISTDGKTAKKVSGGSDYATAVSERCMSSGVHKATFIVGSSRCSNIKIGVVGERQSNLSDNLYGDQASIATSIPFISAL